MTTTQRSQPSDYDATDSSAPAPSPDLWPTPRAYSFDESHTPGLTTLDIRVRGLYPDKKRYWPTPRAAEAAHPGRVKIKEGQQMHLSAAVREDVEPQEDAPAPSTSSTADRPANPLQQRVSALVRAIAGGAGLSSYASLASYSPAGYWQRIQLALFPCDTETGSRPLDEYSTSYPRWGTVSAGASGALLMSALRTEESACSSWVGEPTAGWPTPTSAGEKLAARPTPGMAHRPGRQPGNLLEAIARELWPTPNVPNGGRVRHSPSMQEQGPSRHPGRPLCRASCHDMDTLERSRYSGSRLKEMKQAGQPYRTKTSGMLSARWVSLLMALPPDYLDIPPLPGRAGRRVRAKPKERMSPPD